MPTLADLLTGKLSLPKSKEDPAATLSVPSSSSGVVPSGSASPIQPTVNLDVPSGLPSYGQPSLIGTPKFTGNSVPVDQVNDTARITTSTPATASPASSIYDMSSFLGTPSSDTTKRFTLPNGAIVDEKGTIITPAPAMVPDTTSAFSSLTSAVDKLVSAITGRGSVKDEYNKLLAESGIADVQKSTSEANARAANYRAQYAAIEEEQANAVNSIYGQGRGIPLSLLEGRAARINRQYETRKSSIAALLGVEAATVAANNGQIENAKSLIESALSAYTYDVDSRIKDLATMVTANQTVYNALSQEKKDAIALQEKRLQDERTAKQQEFTNMIARANLAINLSQENRQQADVGLGELSSMDLKRLVDAYPDVDFASLLPEKVRTVIQKSKEPKTYTSSEATLSLVQDKASGVPYKDVIAAIDADPLIANKEQIKKWAAQVYGKAPTDSVVTESLAQAIDSYFGTPSSTLNVR